MLGTFSIDSEYVVFCLVDVKLGSLLPLNRIEAAAAALAADPEATPAQKHADEDGHSQGHNHLVDEQHAQEKSVQASAGRGCVRAHRHAEENRSYGQ